MRLWQAGAMPRPSIDGLHAGVSLVYWSRACMLRLSFDDYTHTHQRPTRRIGRGAKGEKQQIKVFVRVLGGTIGGHAYRPGA